MVPCSATVLSKHGEVTAHLQRRLVHWTLSGRQSPNRALRYELSR